MRMKSAVFCMMYLLALLLPGCSANVPPDIPPNAVPDAGPAGTRENLPVSPPEDSRSGEPSGPAFPLYSFGSCLEESEPVEDDAFFENTAFVGDSRTEGLQLWGGIRGGDYFWKRGITVLEVDSEKYTFQVDGQELTMLGVLARKQYDKVYIMMGINELGCSVEEYEAGFSAFLDQVLALQPDAVIYLQTLPPLNDALAKEYLGDYENNANVTAFNEVIVRLAGEKHVVLLDTAEAYRGEDGQLPNDMTWDGCHFKSGGYAIWADYLRRHTIDPERYFYCRWMEQTSGREPAGPEGEEAAP